MRGWLGGSSCSGSLFGGWLAERRVRDHQRTAATLARNLPAQQIATACQIRESVSLNQVVSLLINQCLKRNKVQLTVRRYEQSGRIAEQRANRLHHSFVDSAGKRLNVLAMRIGEGLP